MKILSTIIFLLLFCSFAFTYQSLQEVFDNADSAAGYDKYIELDPQVEYQGDLWLFEAGAIYLDGNGAKIYGIPYLAAIGVYFSHLDVTECVFIGGMGGVYLGAEASASITNNTIINVYEAGVKTYYITHERQTQVWNNIITGSSYGVLSVDLNWPHYIGYNNIYDVDSLRYAQFVPG